MSMNVPIAHGNHGNHAKHGNYGRFVSGTAMRIRNPSCRPFGLNHTEINTCDFDNSFVEIDFI
jgi:hypothetical protein